MVTLMVSRRLMVLGGMARSAVGGLLSHRLRTICGAALLFVAFGAPQPGSAEFGPIPGWTSLSSSGAVVPGINLLGRPVRYSSPTVAELDANPANGLETVVGGDDGRVYVYRADGSLLWSRSVPPPACARSTTQNRLYASPAVGALHGDGVPWVVAGYGGFGRGNCDGGVVSFRGRDGRRGFVFSLKRFARKAQFGTISHAVFSSPALADTDGDGKLEIAFGGFDRNVYLLEHTGAVRWYYNAADTVFSSPTFFDVNGDGRLELIVGTDISANSRLNPPTLNGGYVYALKTEKRVVKRIGFRDSSAYLWQRYLPQVVYSSPVIANVIGANPGPEVLIGSGCFFPQGSTKKTGRALTVLRLSDGKILRSLRTAACFPSSAGVGDLNGDGIADAVVTVQGAQSLGGTGMSRLTAFDVDAGRQLWDTAPRTNGRNDPFGGEYNSPVVADLDGNGSLEVVVAHNRGVAIHNGADGRALSCTEIECADGAARLYTKEVLRATPAVADLDLDGDLEVVMGSGFKAVGRLYGWTDFSGLGSDPGGGAPFAAPWPMWRGSASHTAVVP